MSTTAVKVIPIIHAKNKNQKLNKNTGEAVGKQNVKMPLLQTVN